MNHHEACKCRTWGFSKRASYWARQSLLLAGVSMTFYLLMTTSGMTTKGISMDRFYRPRDASQQQYSSWKSENTPLHAFLGLLTRARWNSTCGMAIQPLLSPTIECDGNRNYMFHIRRSKCTIVLPPYNPKSWMSEHPLGVTDPLGAHPELGPWDIAFCLLDR